MLPAALDSAVADVRTAFPGLIRRLVEVNASERLVLKLECEGVHEGTWRGIVCPTGRYVVFEERHILAIRDGCVDADLVDFDSASILRQICVGPMRTDDTGPRSRDDRFSTPTRQRSATR